MSVGGTGPCFALTHGPTEGSCLFPPTPSRSRRGPVGAGLGGVADVPQGHAEASPDAGGSQGPGCLLPTSTATPRAQAERAEGRGCRQAHERPRWAWFHFDEQTSCCVRPRAPGQCTPSPGRPGLRPAVCGPATVTKRRHCPATAVRWSHTLIWPLSRGWVTTFPCHGHTFCMEDGTVPSVSAAAASPAWPPPPHCPPDAPPRSFLGGAVAALEHPCSPSAISDNTDRGRRRLGGDTAAHW